MVNGADLRDGGTRKPLPLSHVLGSRRLDPFSQSPVSPSCFPFVPLDLRGGEAIMVAVGVLGGGGVCLVERGTGGVYWLVFLALGCRLAGGGMSEDGWRRRQGHHAQVPSCS
jgi:hypothetical protein